MNKTAQWKAIIKDTILKELRSKTLMFIFLATTAMIVLANSLLKVFLQNPDPAGQIIVNGANSLSYMFMFINFWNIFVAAIFGISAVRSDFREKIIYQYLTFPITRTHYMMGRIFGAWLLVFGYYLYAYILSSVLFSIATHSFVFTLNHLLSILITGIYIFIVIFISFFFSLFTGKLQSFLLVFTTVITVNLSNDAFKNLAFADYFKDLGAFKIIGLITYVFLPRIKFVSGLANAVMFKEEFNLNYPLEALHLLASTALLIFIADYFMKRKDF
jgi:ABC-type transport system involved in multi-copper enzyme maturation permease subunit